MKFKAQEDCIGTKETGDTHFKKECLKTLHYKALAGSLIKMGMYGLECLLKAAN